MAKSICIKALCHLGTSILRCILSYLGIVMCVMWRAQGRRGIEGPEAMARGESTQGAAAAHAMFRTALFGCPGSSEEKQRNERKVLQVIHERAPISEMLGSSHLGRAVLWVFSWNLWIQQSADMLFLAFCEPSSRATGAWLKDTQKHQPPTFQHFQHFHRFNTP